MFQYAFAYALSLKYSADILLELSLLRGRDQQIPGNTPRNYELGIFNIQQKEIGKGILNREINRSNNILYRLFLFKKRINLINEIEFGYHSEFTDVKLPVCLNGYFQSQNYFLGFHQEIRKLFSFPELEKDHHLYQALKNIKNSEQPVSVHFRRGDYVNDPVFKSTHGVCERDYYRNAIDYIVSILPNPVFYFFSDDIEQIEKEYSDNDYNIQFVRSFKSDPGWIDMMLMSNCRHHIIANSSYSWWGAWLSANPDKIVIAPQKWFADEDRSASDIIPDAWIQM